ncbi:aspartate/glutamate racemase family protein [candidate division KSB1 bacterium]|nr:aspartate/glutamate racemase family protein [candidate division KSB1 bacterium]
MKTIQQILNQSEVTFVVTDSGIGGLSVFAELISLIQSGQYFKKAKIIFFNALFDANSGYNRLANSFDKAQQFDKALFAIQKQYQPDLILIACNTLSVIYPDTHFAKLTEVQVFGIVDAGVNLIIEKLDQNPGSSVIIFGTPTTIRANSHGQKLIESGIVANRIIQQGCLELTDSIEKGWNSPWTRKYIEFYAGLALQQFLQPEIPFFASLNCTHYGYAAQIWEAVLHEKSRYFQGLINPNSAVLDFLRTSAAANRHLKTDLQLEVVSKVKISDSTRYSIGNLLKTVSEMAAVTLDNYNWKQDLF